MMTVHKILEKSAKVQKETVPCRIVAKLMQDFFLLQGDLSLFENWLLNY